MIRISHFNRKKFSKIELEEWSRRTGAEILRITFSATKARVTYKGKAK